jgi:RimJ/RimL family protein N-acetyltransferase
MKARGPGSLQGAGVPVGDGRVCLRRFSAADLAAFQAYRSDEALVRFQGWSVQSDHDALQFILAMADAPLFRPGHWIQLAIEDMGTGAMVGDVGVFIADDSRQAEVGFTLSRPAQGKGLATRAVGLAIRLVFEHTQVVEIIGITDTRNTASVRVLERLGMQRRATEDADFKGEACQEHTYVLGRHPSG